MTPLASKHSLSIAIIVFLISASTTSADVLGLIDDSNFKCFADEGMPLADKLEIRERNCVKVTTAWREVSGIHRDVEMHAWTHWEKDAKVALELCKASNSSVHSNQTDLAVRYAVNAWGTYMMRGRECCTMNVPPYCLSTGITVSTLLAVGTLAGMGVMILAAFIGSWWRPLVTAYKKEERLTESQAYAEDPMPLGYQENLGVSQQLCQQLEMAWLRDSCLRTLPGSEAYARATAVAFAALHERFDFQIDSVRCQHEHLLSMWRSTVAVVADRKIEQCEPVDESVLLREGLEDLWTEMLEGFRLWRKKMCVQCPEVSNDSGEGSDSDDDMSLPTLGGARWAPIVGAEDHVSRYLVELISFLLVWGEAGNVRFMPEVLYFITEQVLHADSADSCSRLYGGAPRWFREAGGPYRSGLFLSKIVRPIYNVVFNEWYDRVEGTGAQKDKKVLRSGFENYLPADVANYDDWDELFLDPPRLVEQLVLADNTAFYDLPVGDRFAALHSVDWPRSLSRVKTHREVHSLWGVFAATHRIVLLHVLMFMSGIFMMSDMRTKDLGSHIPLAGESFEVRFAMVGLLAPVFGLAWSFARWETTGLALRKRKIRPLSLLASVGRIILLAAPIVTYYNIRTTSINTQERHNNLIAHYTISALGLIYLLFFSAYSSDALFPLTHVPLRLRIMRDIFWFCVLLVKFIMSLFIFRMVFEALVSLDISMIGYMTEGELASSWASSSFLMHFFIWLAVWSTTFLLFVGDTQLWFCLGCSILGSFSFLVQRRCKVASFVVEDAVAKIPHRFSQKVLTYAPEGLRAVREQDIMRQTRDKLKSKVGMKSNKYDNSEYSDDDTEDTSGGKRFSVHFPAIWDRIVDYMRYEDKIDNQLRGDMSFHSQRAGKTISWNDLSKPIGHTGSISGAGGEKINLPEIFRNKTYCEEFFQDLNPSGFGPSNLEVQWRLKALSRGLGLPMPRPYRAPYIPGITVLIPHYGESILMEKSEVYNEDLNVPLIDWVSTKYEDEFRYFTSRMQTVMEHDWPAAGSHWERYTDEQWEKVNAWTSMRMQTLWRTVAGMALYHPALQCHYEVQGDKSCSLGQPEIWSAGDCFSLIVSMQMYHFFNRIQYEHTNKMLAKFPPCVKIAYIACEDKNETADKDRIHLRQQRRYFSCLIDKTCPPVPGTLKLAPKLTIELPGFPILGDGKGDNQNHAIPFMRGLINQCIDANQGAYFEQMLLLPCALGEFRTRKKGDTHSKRIIGFPEHITSDIGSIGDFAASAEVAFGTLLQRTYAVLGARMHYGHPDLMSKVWMIQQGGVSKATKTLNLSEDIFAGMDFTLRGNNRKIRHCEYFNLAKGRDLGFNTVLGFFSKLSSGAGEQIITRQMFRLHQLFALPEALTFWYAHVGYYMTQFFVSASMPLLCFTWLLMLLSDCHSKFAAFEACGDIEVDPLTPGHRAAEVMANMLGVWFSFLLLFFLVMTSLPLFLELWMEYRFITAFTRFIRQMCTLSPLLFIFQAKTIGHYVMNELRYGGATYVSTGRGLPTERRPFIGTAASSGLKLEKVGGLYLDYAQIAYYDGFSLLTRIVLILIVGGVWNAGAAGARLGFMLLSVTLTIIAWLYAPFVFNPYQFVSHNYFEDMRAWIAFFVEDGGRHWVQWYTTNLLKPRVGVRASIVDIGFYLKCVFLVVWFTVANAKTEILYTMMETQNYVSLSRVWMLAPPFTFSFLFCIIAGPLERGVMFARRKLKKKLSGPLLTDSEEDDAEDDESSPESPQDPVPHQAKQDVVVKREDFDEPETCFKYTPLAGMSLVVAGLDVLEVFMSTRLITSIGWMNALVAVVVMKFSMLDFLLWLFEGVLKSAKFDKDSFYATPISLWLYAHRMVRDLIVSSFIFWTLGLLVLINSINDACLPGCNLHMLLIYRDPGHLKRGEALVVNEDDEEE